MTLKTRGAPSFKRETVKAVIRKRWPQGIPDISSTDLLTQIKADLREIGWPEISAYTITQARNDIEAEKDHMQHRPGFRPARP